MYRENPLKRRLAAGGKCLGAWAALASPSVTEIIGQAGFDFVILDHEHGPSGFETLANDLRALSATRTTSVVRVPGPDMAYIKRALDMGAEGLMCPNVRNAEEARMLVGSAFYPPQGFRGSAYPGARAADYGIVGPHYRDTINQNLVVMAQIESVEGVENLAEIAAVPGIDVIFIGVNDLAGNIGHLDDLQHPDVLALIKRIETAMADLPPRLGSIPHSGLSCQELFDRGYDVAAGFVDVIQLRLAALAAVDDHRQRRG